MGNVDLDGKTKGGRKKNQGSFPNSAFLHGKKRRKRKRENVLPQKSSAIP